MSGVGEGSWGHDRMPGSQENGMEEFKAAVAYNQIKKRQSESRQLMHYCLQFLQIMAGKSIVSPYRSMPK